MGFYIVSLATVISSANFLNIMKLQTFSLYLFSKKSKENVSTSIAILCYRVNAQACNAKTRDSFLYSYFI